MQNTPSSTLRRRRAQLLRQMPALDTLLRGSLIERYKRCGKPGCKCADGPGHGPKYYLSVSFPGRRPQMDGSGANSQFGRDASYKYGYLID